MASGVVVGIAPAPWHPLDQLRAYADALQTRNRDYANIIRSFCAAYSAAYVRYRQDRLALISVLSRPCVHLFSSPSGSCCYPDPSATTKEILRDWLIACDLGEVYYLRLCHENTRGLEGASPYLTLIGEIANLLCAAPCTLDITKALKQVLLRIINGSASLTILEAAAMVKRFRLDESGLLNTVPLTALAIAVSMPILGGIYSRTLRELLIFNAESTVKTGYAEVDLIQLSMLNAITPRPNNQECLAAIDVINTYGQPYGYAADRREVEGQPMLVLFKTDRPGQQLYRDHDDIFLASPTGSQSLEKSLVSPMSPTSPSRVGVGFLSSPSPEPPLSAPVAVKATVFESYQRRGAAPIADELKPGHPADGRSSSATSAVGSVVRHFSPVHDASPSAAGTGGTRSASRPSTPKPMIEGDRGGSAAMEEGAHCV